MPNFSESGVGGGFLGVYGVSVHGRQNVENAAPRRYKIHFECADTDAAPVIGSIIKEVQSPSMLPAGDGRCKITMICMLDQVPMIADLVIKNVSTVERFIVAEEQAPQQIAPIYRAKVAVAPLNTTSLGAAPVVRYLSRRTRVKGGVHPRDTAQGKKVMQLLETRRIIHTPDVADALVELGYAGASASAILSKLSEEGDIVRCGHGAYRAPTDQEAIQFLAQRQAQVRGFAVKGEG